MLRIWRCDCALCVIGNEFPCRQPHNPSATLLRGLSTLPQGQKPLAVSRRKTPDNNMISWKEVASNLPKTILHGRDAILRVRIKWLIFNIVSQLWTDVKYHVPTGFGFSPKASGFYPFGDATALAGEGGVGDVVCLIQASASNHKPKKSDMPHHQRQVRSTGIAKRLFFLCFCFSSPVFFH